MPNTYAHDGSAWQNAADIYGHDGVAWRKAKQIYAHDGTDWRLIFTKLGWQRLGNSLSAYQVLVYSGNYYMLGADGNIYSLVGATWSQTAFVGYVTWFTAANASIYCRVGDNLYVFNGSTWSFFDTCAGGAVHNLKRSTFQYRRTANDSEIRGPFGIVYTHADGIKRFIGFDCFLDNSDNTYTVAGLKLSTSLTTQGNIYTFGNGQIYSISNFNNLYRFQGLDSWGYLGGADGIVEYQSELYRYYTFGFVGFEYYQTNSWIPIFQVEENVVTGYSDDNDIYMCTMYGVYKWVP